MWAASNMAPVLLQAHIDLCHRKPSLRLVGAIFGNDPFTAVPPSWEQGLSPRGGYFVYMYVYIIYILYIHTYIYYDDVYAGDIALQWKGMHTP